MKLLLLKLRDFLKLRLHGIVFPERACFFEKPFDWHCGYGRKITEWQKQELATCNLVKYSHKPEKPTKAAMRRAQRKMFSKIRYQKEKKDVWNTSQKTEMLERGDCEDQAIYIMSLLRDQCTDWKCLGVGIVKGHAFAMVKIGEDDFWIIDNGYLSYSIEKASRLLLCRNLQPICGFNLFEKWSY
ncbi:MAG: hypothetical protein J7J52_04680 [Deltaproteobacteria bacterium]|nr:hypothetical protein [Deltaproteobacteria bacterium]